MRVFAATLGTETNTFSPLPTGWMTFRESLFHRRNASEMSSNFFVLPMKAWKKLAADNGDEFFEGLVAFAQPAGLTIQSVWEELRDMLLADLREAGKVDIVLLNLHGAMASVDCADCEGELIGMVREIVGSNTVIGVELDLHCHLTDRMVKGATAIVMYKEYPHTDIAERAVELFHISREAAAGRTRPLMAVNDCRMLGVWRTSDPPVRALVDHMKAMERGPGVLSVSFGHGFPWADVPDVGAKTLVVTDNDQALAQRLADGLADEIRLLNARHMSPYIPMEKTIAALADGTPGLTVIADVSDNAGGGAASDSTFFLAALLEAGVTKAIFGAVWDPIAVRICEEAGEGSELALRIGGKIGPLSGDPLDLEVRVEKLLADASISFGAGRQTMGHSALVSHRGICIVLNSVRTQTFHPDAFTQFGIDLAGFRVAVVKSAQHFHAGFAPLASRILYGVAPGTVSPDFATLKLPRAGRPLWPQVADPFAAEARRTRVAHAG